MNNSLKYIVYCRRSQDREDRQELSIESQMRELKIYVERHGLNVLEYIREDASAYKRGRPQFKRMLDLIESGKANAVLTWHLTRLARNIADGGMVISLMDEGAIKELRTPEKVYGTTGDDKFMMGVHFTMAKKSSDDTSSFVKNNVKTKIAKGEYPGVAPYGYLNLDTNGVISGKRFTSKKQSLIEELNRPLKRIEFDPIEAPLIRQLIDLALTGAYNLRQLQEEGFKLGLKGKYSNKMLAKQTVINILTSVFYTGRFLREGVIYDGVHDALLTRAEYDRIQAFLFARSRPKKNKREYTYQTLIHCPMCDKLMSGDFQKGNHYYRCGRAKGKNPRCINRQYVRQDVFDQEIEEILKRLVVPKNIVEWALDVLRDQYLNENKTLECKRLQLEKSIRDERAKLTRLTTKWLSPSNEDGSLISDEYYLESKQAIQRVIADHQEELASANGLEEGWIERCEQMFIHLRNLSRFYIDADVQSKKIILQSLGAKFIRKQEKWLVEVNHPFSLIIDANETLEVSEPQKNRISMRQNGLSDAQKSKWLPRLDSNQ